MTLLERHRALERTSSHVDGSAVTISFQNGRHATGPGIVVSQ